MAIKLKTWLAPVLMAALGALIFWPDQPAEFLLWDDQLHLTQNPFVNIWTAPYQGIYSPVLYTIWSALVSTVEFFYPDWRSAPVTGPFIFINIGIHVLNSILVMRVLNKGVGTSYRLAVFAALVFLVHPLHVESVAWISGFKEQLWTTFALFSLSAAFANRWVMSTVLLVFAILAKPTAVILPILIYFLVPKKSRAFTGDVALVVSATVALGVAVATKLIQPNQAINSPVDIASRFAVALDAFGFYLVKMLWPLQLNLDYGRRPDVVMAGGWNANMTIGLMALMATAVWVVWGRRKYQAKAIDAALVFWLFPLIPVLGFLPFIYQNYSTVADRYTYLPVLGFAILVAFAAERGPRLFLYLTGAAILSWAVLSFTQASRWRTNERIFTYVMEQNPGSYMAANNLGVLAQEKGDSTLALAYFEKSFALNSSYAEGAKNLGAMLVNTGQFGRAIAHYRPLVEREPKWPEFRTGYGAALLGVRLFPEAIRELEAALALDPQNAFATEHLAIALSESGRHNEALPLFERAVQLDPNEPSYQLNLQRARARGGHKN